MFDLGFIKDIRFILRRLPHPTQRLNMMFSATLSYRVLELAYEHMNNPELIRIEPDKMTVDRVRQAMSFGVLDVQAHPSTFPYNIYLCIIFDPHCASPKSQLTVGALRCSIFPK